MPARHQQFNEEEVRRRCVYHSQRQTTMSIFSLPAHRSGLGLQYYRLQTAADGRVWYARGNGLVQSTDCTPVEFAARADLESQGVYRLIGSPGNAELIVLLCQHKLAVQTCSPLAVRKSWHRRRPELALPALLSWPAYSSSLGGWHTVTELELATYRLSVLHQQNADEAALAQAFVGHPAERSLTFVRTLDPATAARLLGVLCDPRCFVDFNWPESSSKMVEYLGLRPRNFAAIFADGYPGHHHDLAVLTLQAWTGGGPPPPQEIADDPRCFLQRVCPAGQVPGRKELRASQRFVDFLRRVWLQALTPHREIFVPEYFFKRADEVEGYREWVHR
jgi:hypothetical protein